MGTSRKDYYVVDAMLCIDDKFSAVHTTDNFDIKMPCIPEYSKFYSHNSVYPLLDEVSELDPLGS